MGSTAKNKKVLFVEDDEANQYYMRLILEEIGCKFEMAANGQEALQRVNSEKFDIIFMDLRMPVIDGFSAVEMIRNKIDRDILIVAVSANVLDDIADQCLAAGMNGFIAKGSDVQEFINNLSSWIEKS